MAAEKPSYAELLKEIAELRLRLGEAEPTLDAIRAGEVDAFVIQGPRAEQIVLLAGADFPYQLLMEEMEQGAFTMTPAGQMLYCNRRLAAMLKSAPEQIAGAGLQSFILPDELPRLDALLKESMLGPAKGELTLRAHDGTTTPSRLICNCVLCDEAPILAALITDLTERRQVEARLDQSAEQLRKLAARLQVAREEERTRIAREIHDELGGALTVFKMDLARIRQLAPQAHLELQDRLRAFSESVDAMVQTVRRIATELRPAILDEFGLLAAIEWQLDDFRDRSGIQCKLSSNVEEVALAPASSTAVFRVFQEALTNVARHAHASQVEVRLASQANHFVLQVRDNGRGMVVRDMTDSQSLGLLGMRERIHLLSGTFDINSLPGQGTTIQISLPIHKPDKAHG